MRPHTVAGLGLVALTLATWWWLDRDAQEPQEDGTGSTAVVRQVIDGDTFITTDDERVRLIGIDAPESGGYRPVECGGREAGEAARDLVEGRTVFLVPDDTQPARDRFDRLLAHVELTDGTDVGETLLRAGHAEVFRAAGAFDRRESYDAAQAAARSAGVGIWGRCQG